MHKNTQPWRNHYQKIRQVKKDFNHLKKIKDVSLKPKSTSHFFRIRNKKNKLDLTKLNQVIEVDITNNVAYVEGSTKFYDLANETLKYGLLPQVVPELRNITIGGTISGLGLEASSFKYGMVHNTIVEYEVLTGNGEIIKCTPSKNSKLFYSLPNSLGTIGYILSCKVKLIPAKQYIKLQLTTFDNPKDYFDFIKTQSDRKNYDFLEGYLDHAKRLIAVGGYFSDTYDSSLKYDWKEYSFWKFLRQADKTNYYLSTKDYLWRWDRDTYWTLENLKVIKTLINMKIFRKLFGFLVLRSDLWVYLNTHTQNLRNNNLYKKVMSQHGYENILQDFLIDIDKCHKYFNWHNSKINVYPLWICPVKNFKENYPMHNLRGKYLIDIGIYSGKKNKGNLSEQYYNKLLDKEVMKLDGFKGLYSTTLVNEDEFWSHYNKEGYFSAKNRYDPMGVFPDVFKKAVGEKTL